MKKTNENISAILREVRPMYEKNDGMNGFSVTSDEFEECVELVELIEEEDYTVVDTDAYERLVWMKAYDYYKYNKVRGRGTTGADIKKLFDSDDTPLDTSHIQEATDFAHDLYTRNVDTGHEGTVTMRVLESTVEAITDDYNGIRDPGEIAELVAELVRTMTDEDILAEQVSRAIFDLLIATLDSSSKMGYK